ncbi:phage holin family protein [Enterococcus thailandicus]|uniref:phage holin family protein n=1 Tax=Enterococcus thailandicus TaxID=417368 RepID=UPI0025426B4E|nr:phage holin family protein [Enterococcus thailandicus]MDK4351693.1 phage holin family protein [Enterococcus thailandicus]
MVLIDNTLLLGEFRGLLSNLYIQIFVWIVIGDIVTGICKGIFIKETNSTKGLMGIVKHLLVVSLVLIAYPYLKIMGFEGVATAFVFSYIAVYGISVIENLGQLGIPVPEFVKNRFSKLKDSSEEQGKDKNNTLGGKQ